MKKILWIIVMMVLVGGVGYFVWGKKPIVTSVKSTVYENQYMKVTIPEEWTTKEATHIVYSSGCAGVNCTETSKVETLPGAVNIIKGNYILYINVLASQTSGAIGGRFAEIAMGAPSADAVVTAWPSECGTQDRHPALNGFPRVDMYVGPQDKQEWCNVPIDGKTVWFFSYIADQDDGGYFIHTGIENINHVYTMSYNSKDVNALPEKGSTELNQMLSEMTDIVKMLELKTQ